MLTGKFSYRTYEKTYLKNTEKKQWGAKYPKAKP